MQWKLLIISLFLATAGLCLGQSLTVLYPTPEKGDGSIKVVYHNNTPYIAVLDFAGLYNARHYYRKETGKLVLYFKSAQIKIAASCSFVMVGDRVINMPHQVLFADEKFYVPLHDFFEILREAVIPGLEYTLSDEVKAFVFSATEVSQPKVQDPEKKKPTTLLNLEIVEKQNGISFRIPTEGPPLTDKDLPRFFKEDNWFYLTVYGGSCDTSKFNRIAPVNGIRSIHADQYENSVQFSFKLNRKFSQSSAKYDISTKTIILSLNFPLNNEIKEKLAEAKTEWIIDTIVLDPGHGGKDPGTPGRWGYMHEKDIVLDIALRLGTLLEKEGINVVYTRKTDVFLPLWQRTEVANKANGKLFVSLHVDGADSPNPEGYSFYLLRPGRSEDAIKVAEAENAVIRLEAPEDKQKYEGYDNISNILANMVHSVNMRDSEVLADCMASSFSSSVQQKNRGVKQAGFYVLVGASMPKLLVELGFNSNKNDAKKLNNKWHRQKIAEALSKSIMEFKHQSDNQLIK